MSQSPLRSLPWTLLWWWRHFHFPILPMTNPSHVSRSEPSSMFEFVQQHWLKMSTWKLSTCPKRQKNSGLLSILMSVNWIRRKFATSSSPAIVRSLCRRWSTSPLKKNTSHLQIEGGHIIHAAAIISKMVKGHAHFFPVITFRYARNISRAIVEKNAKKNAASQYIHGVFPAANL